MTNNIVQNIKVDEAIHLILSLVAGLVCFFIFGNPWLIGVAILVGFFIDIDHLFDYFNYFGWSGFKNLKNFFQVQTYLDPQGKVYALLHGFEYVFLFWLLGDLTSIEGFSWVLSLSYLFHLLWDNFSLRNHHPLAYFLTFRLINKFDINLFHYDNKKTI
ncbi:MAG: hypothetical protein PHX72_00665 [Candidatus Shapirobacteria bacterium]|nr:hypothetical protein [Candidatus Shapirobacteria bacterium]